MKRIVTLSACIAFVSFSQATTPAQAQAQTPSSWSLAGAGCVPTGQTASNIGTFNSAGDSKFAAGRTGEIILTCPVPSSIVRVRIFAMTYRDPDGQGAAAGGKRRRPAGVRGPGQSAYLLTDRKRGGHRRAVPAPACVRRPAPL